MAAAATVEKKPHAYNEIMAELAGIGAINRFNEKFGVIMNHVHLR